jgi:integrase
MTVADLNQLFGTNVLIAPATHDAAEWQRAFDHWLAQLPSPNTRRAYTRAWHDLQQHAAKQPCEIQTADLRDWIADLKSRTVRSGRTGYAATTINQYLAAIASFFTYIANDRREQPLGDGHNPASGVTWPAVNRYGKARYLDAAELTAILAVIPRQTLQGKRDLALFLGYIMTGRRNSEWRTIRWGDLQHNDDKIRYTWSGKRKQDQRHELDPITWSHLLNYLRAAGRLDTIAATDYIFTPLNHKAQHLSAVAARVAELEQNRPLSLCHVNRLLKKYVLGAQLDPARITVHTLRHSFAMLLNELGVDVLQISKRLGHSSLGDTMIYLNHLKGVENRSWRQVAAALKLDLLDK